MKKAAKWLLCINLQAWTLLAVQVLTVNMEQRGAQNTVPVQNGDVQAKGEDADAVKKKVALTFDDGPDPDYTEMLFSAGYISIESLQMLVNLSAEDRERYFHDFPSLLREEKA